MTLSAEVPFRCLPQGGRLMRLCYVIGYVVQVVKAVDYGRAPYSIELYAAFPSPKGVLGAKLKI